MPFSDNDGVLHFQFAGGPLRSKEWGIACSVCSSPVCDCEDLTLTFFPREAEDLAACPDSRIVLDLAARTVADKTEIGEEEFAAMFVAEMRGEDWRRLYRIFLEKKQMVGDESDLTVQEYPFDYEQVEYEGLMIHYNAVFPFHNRLGFAVDDQPYLASDQYCLNPHCNCGETSLAFARIPTDADTEKVIPVEDELIVGIDFKTGKWQMIEVLPELEGSADEIVEAFLKKFGRKMLAERRQTLRAMYRYNRNREWAVTERSAPKIGRNSPCPCGSGKKYKKCCGRK